MNSSTLVLAAAILVVAPLVPAQDAASPPTEYFFADPGLKQPLESRMRISRDEVLTFYVDPCVVQSVTFQEEERHTRIYDDIRTLIKSFEALAANAEDLTCKTADRARTSDPMQFTRAKLTVKALGSDPDKPLATRVIVTGPEEHLFIGVDLLVDKKETLKYDPETQSLIPQDTNSQLYLSLNYQLGDIAGRKASDPFTDDIAFKLFFRAGKRPLDSFGVGLGIRLPDRIFGKELNNVSIFAGHFWTKEDKIEGGAPDLKGGVAKGWRIGVTYDLGSALKYFKK